MALSILKALIIWFDRTHLIIYLQVLCEDTILSGASIRPAGSVTHLFGYYVAACIISLATFALRSLYEKMSMELFFSKSKEPLDQSLR
jgi:hypothetical protein